MISIRGHSKFQRDKVDQLAKETAISCSEKACLIAGEKQDKRESFIQHQILKQAMVSQKE